MTTESTYDEVQNEELMIDSTCQYSNYRDALGRAYNNQGGLNPTTKRQHDLELNLNASNTHHTAPVHLPNQLPLFISTPIVMLVCLHNVPGRRTL